MNSYPKSKQLGNHIIDEQKFDSIPSGTEKDLQKLCENYLKSNKWLYIHIPDATWSSFKIRGILRRIFKGLPDLVIFKKNGFCNYALFIELKTKSGKLSQGQKYWGKYLSIHIIRSFEDFEKIIEKFEKIN